MFYTAKEDLNELLKNVDKGELQLPEFQRDFVWNDEDVRNLIASVAKGFPIGALLTLESGGNVQFKPRLLTGVDPVNKKPTEYLLDGQQRMTSLYQATFKEKPVRTKSTSGKIIERYYYLDIRKAVEEDRSFEEIIIGVPGDKKIRSNFGKTILLDLSTQEDEFEKDLFPLNKIFDNRNWFYDWRDYWRDKERDVNDLEQKFVRDGIVDTINRYEMPIIKLKKENTREAICLVFEKVNVGGKKLDAFELITAIYASDNFNLREDWRGNPKTNKIGRRDRIIGTKHKFNVLTKLASTDFLQACTLLHTREKRLNKAKEGYKGKDLPKVSCTRDALLALPLEAYNKYADIVEQGFRETGAFLNEQKIVWHKDVPYPPLIVGLAAAFAILGKKERSAADKEKLAKWFWSVTLGELYGSTTESRLARDVPELVDWIKNNGNIPRSLNEALFQQNRLKSLRSRQSAAYKGIHALIMKQGCRDFISGREADIMTYYDDKIDIHHIFPVDWCKKEGIDPKIFNSIINKTPLSAQSNKSIGSKAPSKYLKTIEDKHGLSQAQLDSILKSHLIEPEYLRNDNFDSFFNDRMEKLANLISNTMYNNVVKETGANETEYEPDNFDDLVEETMWNNQENE
ncbi:MAG: DUF262 domain-containing protein [Bacteroidales bacterium]